MDECKGNYAKKKALSACFLFEFNTSKGMGRQWRSIRKLLIALKSPVKSDLACFDLTDYW